VNRVMNPATNEEYMRMIRAMASAEYRAVTSKREQLACLLFTFSIKRSAVAREFKLSKYQLYRFVKSKGEIGEKPGRPRILQGNEEDDVNKELHRRSAELRPATRDELVGLV
jgi:hypothetical protein